MLLLAILVGIQAVVVVLDLADRHTTRGERYGGRPLRPTGLAFLLVVLAVYFTLQVTGLRLVPDAGRLLAGIRESVGQTFGLAPTTDRPVWWLLGVIAILAYYVAGFWDYSWHRWFSHSRWFFCTHEYHHVPNQIFVTMPGLGARPFAVITVFPVLLATLLTIYGTLALAGLPLWDLTALEIVVLAQVAVNTTSHSCFLRRFWWLHHVLRSLAITTPQEHVLHHTTDLQGNYGNFTILWDRVFGTYLDPTLEEHRGHPLGLAYDQDFLGVLTLGRLKIPDPLRRRWQVGRYCNLDAG